MDEVALGLNLVLVGDGGRGEDEALGGGFEPAGGRGAVLNLPQLAGGVDVAVFALHFSSDQPRTEM